MQRIDIKICGLTNREDAEHALACGADYLGFVLYPRSPRAVTADALAAIVAALPPGTQTVGVFVHTPRAQVEQVCRDTGLTIAQLHGDENATDYAGLAVPVWRVLRIDAAAPAPQPDAWPAARYVLDAAPPGQYGGAGVRGDWERAAALAARHVVMLAGGLTAENVAEAVARVRPRGVDVSSGVEACPGRKDPGRVEAFIRAARAAGETR